jgi:hypothetical protein
MPMFLAEPVHVVLRYLQKVLVTPIPIGSNPMLSNVEQGEAERLLAEQVSHPRIAARAVILGDRARDHR